MTENPRLPETSSQSGNGANEGCVFPPQVHRQVRMFIGYYILWLIAALAALVWLWQSGQRVEAWVTPEWLKPLVLPLLTTILGGAIGNVLYSIRVLFIHYVKKCDYDPRWAGKYVSGPFEAAVLSLVVYALLRGGVASMTGVSLTADVESETQMATVILAALGLGALVGFSIRDVVGWLQNLSATIFRHDETPSLPPEWPEGHEHQGTNAPTRG